MAEEEVESEPLQGQSTHTTSQEDQDTFGVTESHEFETRPDNDKKIEIEAATNEQHRKESTTPGSEKNDENEYQEKTVPATEVSHDDKANSNLSDYSSTQGKSDSYATIEPTTQEDLNDSAHDETNSEKSAADSGSLHKKRGSDSEELSSLHELESSQAEESSRENASELDQQPEYQEADIIGNYAEAFDSPKEISRESFETPGLETATETFGDSNDKSTSFSEQTESPARVSISDDNYSRLEGPELVDEDADVIPLEDDQSQESNPWHDEKEGIDENSDAFSLESDIEVSTAAVGSHQYASAVLVESNSAPQAPQTMQTVRLVESEEDRSVAHSIKSDNMEPSSQSTTRKSSIASQGSAASRTPSVTFKPIQVESQLVQDQGNVIFGVCVVGFHHARGPEVEYWKGPQDMSALWPLLPFQSLPDGSHSHQENFCYFTLLYDEKNKTAPEIIPAPDSEGVVPDFPQDNQVTTLFGISCNRQIRASELRQRTADITRSTVQKSVVVVARKPIFGPIKEKLAVITRAYFLQGDFEDRRIIDTLYDNLVQIFSGPLDESELYVGMSLRELIHRLKSKVLVLFKALFLEKKLLFYASNTETLCSSQFSLVSLIPNLINHLEDCGSPLLNSYEHTLHKPTSLRTSDRNSLLAFMGLPIQLFGPGGMFCPYVPLQQIHDLRAPQCIYYLAGSSNSLLVAPGDLADIVVNVSIIKITLIICLLYINMKMDDNSVDIRNHSLNSALSLSSADKRWIDSIVQSVEESWDEEDTWNMDFYGSEDYIRMQFEDYIMGLLSSAKYDVFLQRYGPSPPPEMLLREIEGNPIGLFGMNWVNQWRSSNNYRIFTKFTDEELFDVVEPRHVAAGPVTLLDFKKIAQQVNGLHIEKSAEAIGKTFSRWWTPKKADESPKEPEEHEKHEEHKEHEEDSQGAVSTKIITEKPTISEIHNDDKEQSDPPNDFKSRYLAWQGWAKRK